MAALAPSGVAAAAGRSIVLPGQTPEGEHVLSVLVKRTYRIRHGYPVTRSPADAALVPGDVHFGDPMNSTVRHESDFVPWKCETDVVLDGTAQSPDGTPVQALTARLAIGNASKSLLVLGDRIAHHRDRQPALFSDPRPFTTMPLRYELAYGGVDVRSDPAIACVYGRNHLGRGFVIRDAAETVDGLALPNIEDPEDRLTPQRLCCGHFMEMDRQPVPQCFGWIMKYWRPRMLLAGVMPADAALARELRTAYRRVVPPAQWPLYDQTELPPMDFRFFNGASPGLVMPYLVGDEGVQLDNLSPGGVLAFQLPGERPAITLDIGFGPARGETVLQTVMIRVDAGEVDLVWRAATPFPGPDWLPEMRRFDLDIAG